MKRIFTGFIILCFWLVCCNLCFATWWFDAQTQAVTARKNAGGLTITNVTVYATIKILTTNEASAIRIGIRTEAGTSSYGGYVNLTTDYQEFNAAFATNPDDSQAWELTDLDGLLVRGETSNIDNQVNLTHEYLLVNWSDSSTTILRPNADVVGLDGNWLALAGGGVLNAEIDEVSADADTSYIYTTGDFTAYGVEIANP